MRKLTGHERKNYTYHIYICAYNKNIMLYIQYFFLSFYNDIDWGVEGGV